jgi:replication factor A1
LSLTSLARILVLIDMEVLEDLGTCEKLGEPKGLPPIGTNMPPPPPPSAPAPIPSTGFYGKQAQPPQHQQQHQPQYEQQQQQQQQEQAPELELVERPCEGMMRKHIPEGMLPVYPIEALSPYANKWTIKARCTFKSDIRHWHNRNGEGKLFSVNLLDETGEIKATCFNEQCDQWYEFFQEGQVYYITSPCRVQFAKKQFTNLNNDYELTFERDTQVEKVLLP